MNWNPPCWAATNESRQCFHFKLYWRLGDSFCMRPQGRRAACSRHLPQGARVVRLVSRFFLAFVVARLLMSRSVDFGSYLWHLSAHIFALFPKHFAVASIKRGPLGHSDSAATVAKRNKFGANSNFNSLNVSRKNGLR